MQKDIKLLYETSVKKLVEEQVKENRVENGETLEITRTIKKAKPISIALRKPDRKINKAGEMFYAKSLAEYLKMGLMPFSLVAKRYANDGGVLTDKETNRIKELKAEAVKLEAVFYGIDGSETVATPSDKNAALRRLNEINMEVSNISNAYADIYDTTVEIKARNDTMEWWVLSLAYIKLDDKEYTPLFAGETHEERIASWEVFEDRENEFEMEVMKKLSFLTSFYITARNSSDKAIDFPTMDKLYEDSMSTYKVEVSPEIKIADGTPPAETPTVVAAPEVPTTT